MGCLRFTKSLIFCALLLVSACTSRNVESVWEGLQGEDEAYEAYERAHEKGKKEGNQTDKPQGFNKYFALVRGYLDGRSDSGYAPGYRFREYLAAISVPAKKGGLDLRWVSQGPANVSGRTRALLVDPDNHNRWYAASVSGGVWLTENKGATWTNLTDNVPNLAVCALAMAPSNHNLIFAGTGEGFGNIGSIRGDGIFKSSDRGATWTQLLATAQNANFAYVNQIVVDAKDAKLLYAATNSGVFKSTDGGTTWTTVLKDVSPQSLVAATDKSGVLLAGVNSAGVYKSDSTGLNWRRVLKAANNENRFAVTGARSNENRYYAVAVLGTDSDSKPVYYTSTDKGENWQQVLPSNATDNDNFLGEQGWYDLALEADPTDDKTLFCGGVYLGKITLAGGVTALNAVTSVTTTNLDDLVTFTNFNASLWNGRIENGTVKSGVDVTNNDLKRVEIRFGPGLSQKAHRFTVASNAGTNGNGGAGVSYADYTYRDYVTVPFQVWDLDANQQLMVSFRDNERDGKFDLKTQITSTDNIAREYLMVHTLPYNASAPDPNIAGTKTITYKMIYFMWPTLKSGSIWDETNLPNAQLTIEVAKQTQETSTPTMLSDSRNNGPNKTLHADHHILLATITNAATGKYFMLSGNDGGLGISEDNGLTWQQLPNANSSGYITTQFYGAAKSPGVEKYFGGMQDNGTWLSGLNPGPTGNYTFEIGGDGFEVLWHATDPKKMMGGAYNNNFQRSTDGGTKWTDVTGGLVGKGPFLSRLASSDNDPNTIFAVASDGIWRSENFGISWTVFKPTLGWDNVEPCVVRVSIASPSIVWAGGGMMGNSYRIHLSQDKGKTFTALANDATKNGSTITNIATHPTDPNAAYLLFSQDGVSKILKTKNLGKTWDDISGFKSGTSTTGFPNVPVYSLFVFPNETNRIWAGTEIGIFETDNDAESWHILPGFPAVSVWQMTLRDGQLLVATHGRGLFTTYIPGLYTPTENTAQLATMQLYPNPASTALHISLPTAYQNEVQNIQLIDLAGRVQREITDRNKLTDSPIEMNLEGMRPGTYIVRMRGHKIALTQKILIAN
ncbi:MAG: hypothetical protein RIS47_500 [Bacteroidota bacterium]